MIRLKLTKYLPLLVASLVLDYNTNAQTISPETTQYEKQDPENQLQVPLISNYSREAPNHNYNTVGGQSIQVPENYLDALSLSSLGNESQEQSKRMIYSSLLKILHLLKHQYEPDKIETSSSNQVETKSNDQVMKQKSFISHTTAAPQINEDSAMRDQRFSQAEPITIVNVSNEPSHSISNELTGGENFQIRARFDDQGSFSHSNDENELKKLENSKRLPNFIERYDSKGANHNSRQPIEYSTKISSSEDFMGPKSSSQHWKQVIKSDPPPYNSAHKIISSSLATGVVNSGAHTDNNHLYFDNIIDTNNMNEVDEPAADSQASKRQIYNVDTSEVVDANSSPMVIKQQQFKQPQVSTKYSQSSRRYPSSSGPLNHLPEYLAAPSRKSATRYLKPGEYVSRPSRDYYQQPAIPFDSGSQVENDHRFTRYPSGQSSDHGEIYLSSPSQSKAYNGVHLQQVYPPLSGSQQFIEQQSGNYQSSQSQQQQYPTNEYQIQSNSRNVQQHQPSKNDLLNLPQTIQITAIPNNGLNLLQNAGIQLQGNALGLANGNGLVGTSGLFGLNGGGLLNNGFLDPFGRQVVMLNAERRQIDWSFWIWPLLVVIALPLVLGALFVPVFLKTIIILIQVLQSLGLLLPITNALNQQIAQASGVSATSTTTAATSLAQVDNIKT